jgi:3-phosphoshikimate 1-carboxyvinyltransferase
MKALAIEPLAGRLDAEVTVPGAKSLTNRAVVCAALAEGTSTITNALAADDTAAMVDCVRRLGISVDADEAHATLTVHGGSLSVDGAVLNARQSGTTARFIAPVVALGRGAALLDGAPQLRTRPMADLAAALRTLGTAVDGDQLPIRIHASGLEGGEVTLPADVSSQFASGLLLASPLMTRGLVVRLITSPVSRPYLDMTCAVMRAFGADVRTEGDRVFRVAPTGYGATTYAVEPDASAASYFFAAAAICGGRVRVEGLGRSSQQGDLAFVDVLERMGATVEVGELSTTVVGAAPLHGIEADLSDLSDTAPTLGVVAAFASSPTRVTGIGFVRNKESDRIAAVVAELRRLGVDAVEEPDGFLVRPGAIRAGRVETYDDHRLAMAFALVGLRVPGMEIADPGCVAKTFPGFFETLEELRVS